jgi:hypothetical protein
MLKNVLIAACLALPLAAIAADEKKMTPQQQKMATCNKEAGDKKLAGDERKKFMSECLSGGQKMTQQDKMTQCNKQAGEKKLAGEERKKFMSSCLSG